MRDLLSKIVTGSMVAGAALLVVACGSNEDATANNTVNVEETMPANDMTNVDAMNGAGADLGAMDSTNGTTTDTTVNTTTTETTTNTSSASTNGM